MKVQVHDAVGHFDPAQARAAEREQAVDPGRAGHGSMPVIANGKGVGERMDGRQRAAIVKAHDFGGVCELRASLRVIRDEAAVGRDAAVTAQLYENVGGRVNRIIGDLPGRPGLLVIGLATVLVASAQVVLGAHFGGAAENVVEGPILEHQNNDVLDGIVCHNIPAYSDDFCAAGKYHTGSAGRATRVRGRMAENIACESRNFSDPTVLYV
jgi:hypothetical protein